MNAHVPQFPVHDSPIPRSLKPPTLRKEAITVFLLLVAPGLAGLALCFGIYEVFVLLGWESWESAR